MVFNSGDIMKTRVAVILFLFTVLLPGYAALVIWDGGGDAINWFDGQNWSPNNIPQPADEVTITNVTTVRLTNSATVASLLVSNATVTFYGTNTILTASNVVVAGTNGRITHAIQTATTTNEAGLWLPSNLVWIVCTNFTVESAGAAVNADGMGYAGGAGYLTHGYGPGNGKAASSGYGGGGGYGGQGGIGTGVGAFGGDTNGSELYPFDPGSGGGGGTPTATGGAGGGAVRITVDNVFTINGTISANGANGISYAGGGSGGGIYIRCNTLDGAGSIRADGGNSSSGGGGGGGGRIAVRCLFTRYLGTCSVTNGTGYQPGQVGTIYWRIQAPGTLFRVW